MYRTDDEISQPVFRTESEVLGNALSLWRAGYSVMPAGDGHWLADWGRFKTTAMTEDQVRTHFGGDRGFGADIDVMCGPVSKHLRNLDFDNHTGSHAHVFPAWRDKLCSTAKSLFYRLTVFRTKTAGGYRVCWRCEAEPERYGDAVATVLHDGKARDIIECLDHCKVPGGYTAAYEYVSGPRLEDLGTVMPHEQDLLMSLAVAFHEYDPPFKEYKPARDAGANRPGDFFNERAVWTEVLGGTGWELSHAKNDVQHWIRPGKSGGTSARTGYNGDHRGFYVFTTAADPFEVKTRYSPFAVYALLHHGGDFGAAARTIRTTGFGSVPPFAEHEARRDGERERQVEAMFASRQPTPAPERITNAKNPEPEPTPDPDGKFKNWTAEANKPAEWGAMKDLKAMAGGVVPPFPVEHLAVVPEFRALVDMVSDSVQIAPDVPALMGLAVLSAACAGRVKVAVRPNAYLATVLWTASALPPGERKSPAVEPLIRPIKLWEDTQRKELEQSVRTQRAHRQVAREKIKALERQFKKCSDPDQERELTARLIEYQSRTAGPEPEVPRVLVEDATPESLVPILERHHGRAACLSDEATFLEVAMGRYSNDPKLELYLKGHDGGDYRCDRAGREPVYLPKLHVTFGFCIQNDALKKYAADPVATGRGFMARFLVAYPQSWVGRRAFRLRPDADRDAVQAAWDRLVVRMLDDNRTRHLDHGDDGYALIRETEEKYEPLLAETGPLAAVRSWAAKAISGQMLRVAGLLHVASGDPSNTVSMDALTSARHVIEYFLEHAKFQTTAVGDDVALDLAGKIRDKIVAKNWKQVTKNQFKRFAWVGKDASDDVIDAAYGYLTAANVVRVAKTTGQTTTFEVNPALVR